MTKRIFETIETTLPLLIFALIWAAWIYSGHAFAVGPIA